MLELTNPKGLSGANVERIVDLALKGCHMNFTSLTLFTEERITSSNQAMNCCTHAINEFLSTLVSFVYGVNIKVGLSFKAASL